MSGADEPKEYKLYLNLANELDVNLNHVDWEEGFDKSQKLWKIHKR